MNFSHLLVAFRHLKDTKDGVREWNCEIKDFFKFKP